MSTHPSWPFHTETPVLNNNTYPVGSRVKGHATFLNEGHDFIMKSSTCSHEWTYGGCTKCDQAL